MPKTAAFAAALAFLCLSSQARAQDDFGPERDREPVELKVVHAPFEPEIERRVRDFVLGAADNFSGFYPDARFAYVRAVWFPSGSIIICGQMNKRTSTGAWSGWHYFTNSGPLIFESDQQEILCDQRTYFQPGYADDYEYGPQFTEAASNTQVAGEPIRFMAGPSGRSDSK